MADAKLRVGIVGYGMMGRAHGYGYRVAPMLRRLPVTPVVTVMSGRNQAAVEAAATAYGVPATVTDWRDLITRDDVESPTTRPARPRTRSGRRASITPSASTTASSRR